MEPHLALTDQEFEAQFKGCELATELFSHEAHLRLTWIHVSQYGREQAEENIIEQLQNYVAFVGVKDKFNKTVTIAAVRIISNFIDQSNSDNFTDFIQDFPQLKTAFKAILQQHYSFEIFDSNQTKAEYFEPDLKPFQ